MFIRKESGFTLVELLIVIVIIGILAAIALPRFTQNRQAANAAACSANISILDSAIQRFNFDKDNPYATNQDMNKNDGGLVPTYVKAIPTCQSGGVYKYSPETGVTCSFHDQTNNDNNQTNNDNNNNN